MLEYHASSHSFDEMVDSHREQLCTAPDAYEGQYDEAYKAVAAQIDAIVVAEPNCTIPEDRFRQLPFLSANPPAPIDLVAIFEANTRHTMNAAVAAVRWVLESNSSIDCVNGSDAKLLTLLDAVGLPEVDGAGEVPPYGIAFHLFPTIYHKLMMMCYPTGTSVEFGGVCEGLDGNLLFQDGSGRVDLDGNIVFDLVTAGGSCTGQVCKKAARALINYHALLMAVTRLRTDMVRTTYGYPRTQPALDASTWTVDRSCKALSAIVDNAIVIRRGLPNVTAALRAASPQLATSCIAGDRYITTGTAFASRLLGGAAASANEVLWKSSSAQLDMCCAEGVEGQGFMCNLKGSGHFKSASSIGVPTTKASNAVIPYDSDE